MFNFLSNLLFIENRHSVYKEHYIMPAAEFYQKAKAAKKIGPGNINLYAFLLQLDPEVGDILKPNSGIRNKYKNNPIKLFVRGYYIYKDLYLIGIIYSPYESAYEVYERLKGLGMDANRSILLPGRGASKASLEYWSSED